MRNSILKMADSTQRSINLLPQTAHSATICGQTGCGENSFHLGSARRPLPGVLSTHRGPVPNGTTICLGPHAEVQLCPEGNGEQTRWVCLFNFKDRDSFEDCLRENDVILSREQRVLVRKLLTEMEHAKLLLKTDQPVGCTVLSDV